MPETWFISDTHFGHKNILEFEKFHRPFDTLEQMHEVMIERWNSVVADNDIVYHLGDFCFGKASISIAGRLKGRKKLVLGNHDTYPSALYLEYFDKLYGCVFWERCVLSHMPIHTKGLGARWWLNVHGHLHSRLVMDGTKEDINYYNVSCEQNYLTPVNADDIRERVRLITAERY